MKAPAILLCRQVQYPAPWGGLGRSRRCWIKGIVSRIKSIPVRANIPRPLAAGLLGIVIFTCFSGCTKINEKNSNIPEKTVTAQDSINAEITKYRLGEKINEYDDETFDGHKIFVEGKITEYKNNYLYYYGKTKEDIIAKYGSGYAITDVEEISQEYEKDIYGYGFDYKETMEYDGLKFDVYSSDDSSAIMQFHISRGGEKFFDTIFIGCDMAVIIKQLGKPNEVEEEYNSIQYDVAGNFQMRFTINDNFKLENIYVYEDL